MSDHAKRLPNGNIELPNGAVITPETLQKWRESLDPAEGLRAMSIDRDLNR